MPAGPSPALCRMSAERLLPAATGLIAGQLRARLLRELLKADPGLAAERYERSITLRRVHLTANDDTTACLSGIFLPPAKAAAAYERVDAIARGLKRDGETRTLDQLRADVFCDLLTGIDTGATPIARPGIVELLVPLDTLTGQSDTPGHLAGYGPVIADIARQVAAQQAQQKAHNDADEARNAVRLAAMMQWRYRVHDTDGRLLYHGITRARRTAAGDAEASDADGSEPLFDLAAINAAARPAACRAEPVAPGVFALRMLDPCPPAQADPTDRYPNAAMRRWVAARDSTCRAPGCTAPARICDTDHTEDHATGGPTTDDNLGLLCRHHHRLKHEGGHHLVQITPGEFRWISPHCRTYEVDPDPPW